MAQTSRSADLTSGPMLQKIILFSIPLAASSILQLLFNAADVVVVGRFAGSTALAAVGSNGSLINLLVNLFVGLSLGANVVAARCFGAKDDHGVQDTVQTSVTLGFVSGVLLAVVGFFAARGLLELMSCPEDVIDLSALYLKIYFIGMPMTMLYNFSSALLRAVGDTKRPLYCLAAAGIINVVLNLVFVIGFSMSVAGVALATIISQTVSALLVTGMLVREKGALRLDLRRLAFHAGTLKQILLIGLPAGLQSTVFSLSNVVIFRLPFPVPDPIINYKASIAKDALMDVNVPEMVIKLKQGIGRLIRNFTDTGIVCIIDPRLRDDPAERYHDIAWTSLPIKNRTKSLDMLRKFYESLPAAHNETEG